MATQPKLVKIFRSVKCLIHYLDSIRVTIVIVKLHYRSALNYEIALVNFANITSTTQTNSAQAT